MVAAIYLKRRFCIGQMPRKAAPIDLGALRALFEAHASWVEMERAGFHTGNIAKYGKLWGFVKPSPRRITVGQEGNTRL